MDKINLYYFTVGDSGKSFFFFFLYTYIETNDEYGVITCRFLAHSVTRARGENVKLLLEDAGLDHEYIRVKHEEWPALKQKIQAEGLHSATLPFIETNGQKFVKAPAIMRYISTKLGGKYHGSTPEENQLLDVVAELNDVWFEHLKNSFFGSEVSVYMVSSEWMMLNQCIYIGNEGQICQRNTSCTNQLV